MDETKMISEVMALVNEMWVYIAAIWCTVKLFGDAIPQIPNKLLAIIVAVLYGAGAHLSGYLQGGWFVVLAVKTPIAAIASHLVEDHIYKVFKREGAVAVSNIVAVVTGTGDGTIKPPR